MHPIKCIILEDTPADLELLLHFVKAEPRLQLLQTFANPLEAISFITTNQPTLIFMDIDMPVMSGLDLFKKLDYGPVCVFVTAHSGYALDSYEAQGFDFILKPVMPNRFAKTMARIEEYLDVKTKAELYNASFENQGILLKEGTTTHRVELQDILYLEALKDYTKVVAKTRKYITLSKLKDFMDKLPPADFVRIHRSYAVAKNKIESLVRDEITINKTVLPIGKTYKQEIKAMM